MNAEKLNAICDAVDQVMVYGEQNKKAMARKLAKTFEQLTLLASDGGKGRQQKHADVIRIGELEAEAGGIAHLLESWTKRKADALSNLEDVVGLGVRRTVSPRVQELVKSLATVMRPDADGTMRGLSLSYIALACGLSDGTVSKLKSGTYPASVFPATVKRGRRAARR